MKKQSGFTLVEFLVAMGVTLVALAAATLAFKDATNTNQRVSLNSDMADNLRAGMNLIQQDLLQAGEGIPVGGIAIPNNPGGACPGATNSSVSSLNRPAPSNATFPICNLTAAAIEPGDGLGPFITSPDATSTQPTDLITMMYTDNTLSLDKTQINQPASVGPPATPACAGVISPTGVFVTFDPTCLPAGGFSANGTEINPGDLIMFSNANGQALQEVTSVSGVTLNFASGDAFNLNGTGAPAGTLIQLQNYTVDALGNKVFNLGTYPPTTATRIWMVTYYLDNVTDPAHVRLIRRVNFTPGQPVGETLEDLQATYNFVNGTVVLANQSVVPNGYSEGQIRSVGVFLGARSTDPIFVNQRATYVRSSLQTLVCLRSLSYVNQYH